MWIMGGSEKGTGKPYTHPVFYCLKKDLWCCPTGNFDASPILNTTCCARPDLTFKRDDPVVYTLAQVKILATISSATTITPTAPGAQASNQAFSQDEMIGVKVGVPLGVALAVALGVIVWLMARVGRLKRGYPTGGELEGQKVVEYAHVYGQVEELQSQERVEIGRGR